MNEFGENFNPSVLDSIGDEREGVRKSVLNVLKKIADHSSQNLKRNTNGYLASVPHNNDTLLWPGGKDTQSDKFSLSYFRSLLKLQFNMSVFEHVFHKELNMINCFCGFMGLSHHCTRKIKGTIKIINYPTD